MFTGIFTIIVSVGVDCFFFKESLVHGRQFRILENNDCPPAGWETKGIEMTSIAEALYNTHRCIFMGMSPTIKIFVTKKYPCMVRL